MRTFAGLLLFEDIFDLIPDGEADLVNLGNSIFTPNLLVVEEDCNTMLGKFEIVNFEAEGLVELATDLNLTKGRITQLLTNGIYEIATRHSSTCISENGICAKCFAATYQNKPYPKVNDRVTVLPEYLVNAEIIPSIIGNKDYGLSLDPTEYTKVYIYSEGVLLKQNLEYIIKGTVLSIFTAPTTNTDFVIRYISQNNSSFLSWLANTYSGSILGISPLPSQKLPVRSLLLSSLLTENRLQLISEIVNEISSIPNNYAGYADQIKDPLEKALFLLALYSIYSNVIT